MIDFNSLSDILNQHDSPIFTAKDGVIEAANLQAEQHEFVVGTPIESILKEHTAEYVQMKTGRLLLQINMGHITYDVSIIRALQRDVFYLNKHDSDHTLHALGVASQVLRGPLSEALLCADLLDGQHIQTLRRSLNQLLRAISNMSDVSDYDTPRAEMYTYCNIPSLFDEIASKAAEYLQSAGITLSHKNIDKEVYSEVDKDKLIRGVLNMISNAAKYTAYNAAIELNLRCDNGKIRISATNHYKTDGDSDFNYMTSAFHRDPRSVQAGGGIGLGMSIAAFAAFAHKGTLMFDTPSKKTIRLTMTIPIQNSNRDLRSPVVLPVDYSGGYNNILMELSDILPSDVF